MAGAVEGPAEPTSAVCAEAPSFVAVHARCL